jgi:hypothetical protein
MLVTYCNSAALQHVGCFPKIILFIAALIVVTLLDCCYCKSLPSFKAAGRVWQRTLSDCTGGSQACTVYTV